MRTLMQNADKFYWRSDGATNTPKFQSWPHTVSEKPGRNRPRRTVRGSFLTISLLFFSNIAAGWSDTPAVDEAFGDAKKYLQPLRTPWEGAEGITWLVGTAKKNIRSGEVYLDRTVQPKHIAGLFYSTGSYTKNTPAEVDAFMSKLKEAAGIWAI